MPFLLDGVNKIYNDGSPSPYKERGTGGEVHRRAFSYRKLTRTAKKLPLDKSVKKCTIASRRFAFEVNVGGTQGVTTTPRPKSRRAILPHSKKIAVRLIISVLDGIYQEGS